MKTVLLRAPVLTQSGYGVHSRQIARWLLDLEKAGKIQLTIQVLSWGDTPWLLDSEKLDGFVGEVMKHATPIDKVYDVTFQLQLPNEWDPKLGRYNVGITAAVETDRCNPEWVKHCNAMNAVVVPSEHTKTAIKNTGLVVPPIHVIGESYPDVFREEKTVDLNLSFETDFNYLVFGQITGTNPENDRKNIFYTLKWMCESLKDKPNAGIVIKTNGGRNTKIDRGLVRTMLVQLLNEIRPSGGPPVYLVHGEMSDVEVYSLLKHPQIKAMVSLTRGEGFGLPLLEAAAAGLPVIATNWSAHTEFLNLGKWISINHILTEVHPSRIDKNIFMKGARWAQPLEEDFKRKLRKFHESPTIPSEWAKDLKEKILQEFSHERITSLYSQQFESHL